MIIPDDIHINIFELDAPLVNTNKKRMENYRKIVKTNINGLQAVKVDKPVEPLSQEVLDKLEAMKDGFNMVVKKDG